jgi:hypothetical protein
MVDDKQGDDLFDAYLAAVWGLVSRGATDVVTLVETRKTRREHLLGEAPVRLPSDPMPA